MKKNNNEDEMRFVINIRKVEPKTDTKAETLSEFLRQLTAPEPVPQDIAEGIQPIPTRTGIVFETNQDTYDHYLEVFPPHLLYGDLFCFAEGNVPYTLFYRRGKRLRMRLLTADETRTLFRLSGIHPTGIC
jgi:hypothetical protein